MTTRRRNKVAVGTGAAAQRGAAATTGRAANTTGGDPRGRVHGGDEEGGPGDGGAVAMTGEMA